MQFPAYTNTLDALARKKEIETLMRTIKESSCCHDIKLHAGSISSLAYTPVSGWLLSEVMRTLKDLLPTLQKELADLNAHIELCDKLITVTKTTT